MKSIIYCFLYLFFMLICDSCVSTSKIETKLREAFVRDQEPRSALNNLILSGETDGDALLPLIEQIAQNDSINRKEIFPIIDKIIERDIYNLDTVSFKTCWLVIQHSGINDILRYASFVKGIAERNLISKNSYMAFIDRQNIDRGIKQLYGIQLYRFSGGEIIQYPVDSCVQYYWNEIGIDYDLTSSIPKEITLAHPTVFLGESEFAIIGSIYKEPAESPVPMAEIPLYVNSRYVTSSDSSGYFSMVLNKGSIIPRLSIVIDGKENELSINYDSNRDFSIIEYFASSL